MAGHVYSITNSTWITSSPFDHEDWLFELKYDGFRAMAIIENRQCRFVSRNLNPLRGLDSLAHALVKEIKVDRAILDGELAVIDEDGRSIFKSIPWESVYTVATGQ